MESILLLTPAQPVNSVSGSAYMLNFPPSTKLVVLLGQVSLEEKSEMTPLLPGSSGVLSQFTPAPKVCSVCWGGGRGVVLNSMF